MPLQYITNVHKVLGHMTEPYVFIMKSYSEYKQTTKEIEKKHTKKTHTHTHTT